MRAHFVVVPAPALDHHLGFGAASETRGADNLPTHRVTGVRETIEARGCRRALPAALLPRL
jgi:hypothetical protein